MSLTAQDIAAIKVGDRIKIRPLTREGYRTVERNVTAVRKPAFQRSEARYNGRGTVVCVRYAGWSDFELRDYEILEVVARG